MFESIHMKLPIKVMELMEAERAGNVKELYYKKRDEIPLESRVCSLVYELVLYNYGNELRWALTSGRERLSLYHTLCLCLKKEEREVLYATLPECCKGFIEFMVNKEKENEFK